MLCIAAPMDEVVLCVTEDVVALDKFTTKFGITIPAAHTSIFHCRVYRRLSISFLFPLTLPAFPFCCLRNLSFGMVIARCELVFVIVAAIMESVFGLNARHSGGSLPREQIELRRRRPDMWGTQFHPVNPNPTRGGTACNPALHIILRSLHEAFSESANGNDAAARRGNLDGTAPPVDI